MLQNSAEFDLFLTIGAGDAEWRGMLNFQLALDSFFTNSTLAQFTFQGFEVNSPVIFGLCGAISLFAIAWKRRRGL